MPVNVDDLHPGQLLQLNSSDGSDLYKLCEVYPNGTATVEWISTWPRGADSAQLPPRTRVTRISADQLFDFIEPADRFIALYNAVLDGRTAPAPSEQW